MYPDAIKIIFHNGNLTRAQMIECYNLNIIMVNMGGQISEITEGVIQDIVRIIKENNGKVLLGHTDSLYVSGITNDLAKEISEKVTKDVGIDFELQGHYKYIAVWRKANYFIVADGKRTEKVCMMGRKQVIHVPRWLRLMQIYLRDIKIFNVDKVFGLKPFHNFWRPDFRYFYEDLT